MEDLHLGASALAPALKVQTETQENMIVLLLHQKQQLALLLVLGALALVLIRLLFQMRLQQVNDLLSLLSGVFLLLEFWQQW